MGYFSVSEFETWNTGVACGTLTAGDYYCVADYSPANLPMPSTMTTTPSPVQTGITSSCTAWYLAAFGDDCATIPQIFGTFSESDFLSWNPALGGTACAGLVPGDYYCVAGAFARQDDDHNLPEANLNAHGFLINSSGNPENENCRRLNHLLFD